MVRRPGVHCSRPSHVWGVHDERSVGQKLSRHVVDGRDVIGVECVPRSQGPCCESNTEADAELGIAGIDEEIAALPRPACASDTRSCSSVGVEKSTR
jgi:hypothetical protein